ncbi:MATE family efflux transporter (plasmid) [Gemmobacter fulvus]|uniref:MATE family efflux transporter n=1 Tax=Gemmobacter fulvus TaxID=2840474 RepID=A0A975PBE7_9RHOB|nr:MATE family efflux transporter [Gemmobacter fulvus]MBT9247695.1 MATE family efflux transporter [Gemmobacter fulvus]QWK92877.1 MATE family efflux transporter [Gemmobacter fulvus]
MTTAAAQIQRDPRTQRLLDAPILPLLVRMALPNALIMLAQASTGLIETFWVSKVGTDALAGMALVFPVVMLMTMISAGAVGGAVSSSIARALGSGRRADADALVLHAVVVNVVIGLGFSVLFLIWGRPIYTALGGRGGELEAAILYSNVVFAGNVFTWLMNGLGSVIRGAGNMLVPALVSVLGVVFLIPVSPMLIFGFGPVPAMGIAGGGLALVLYYVVGAAILGLYIVSGRNPARFRWLPLQGRHFAGILKIGAFSSVQSVISNVVIAGSTAIIAARLGVEAVAGFGTGIRLEYLLIPLVFGIGAPMVALVGTNAAAGLQARARQIALTGAVLAFAVTETVGLIAALFPVAWLTLFSAEPEMIEAGRAYLQIVGPFYGFFGLGLVLYFAAQGQQKLALPLMAGIVRLVIALGGGWLALNWTGDIRALYLALGLGLLAYGVIMLAGVVRR